jgi:uncharacterized membrane protein YfcA
MGEVFFVLGLCAVGAFTGFCAGLLGISGGVITVPLLTLMFHSLDFPKTDVIYFAIGTSFAATVFSALSSTLAYQRRGNVLWSVFRTLLPGIVLGSVAGAIISQFLSGNLLMKLFGIFECLIGFYFLFAFKAELAARIPSPFILRLISFGVGMISNILGIGGGTFVAPTLMAFHIPTQKAIGTSSASGLIISFLGAICYLIYGLEEPIHYPYTVGYLYVPAFLIISLMTFLIAPLGTRVAHSISTKRLRTIFAIVLIVVGILMGLD